MIDELAWLMVALAKLYIIGGGGYYLLVVVLEGVSRGRR